MVVGRHSHSAASNGGGGYANNAAYDVSAHAGLINLGNTCFLNSVLQATSSTQSLHALYRPAVLLDSQNDPHSRSPALLVAHQERGGQTTRSKQEGESEGKQGVVAVYEPTAEDLPLNTAFRRVLERTWGPDSPSSNSGSLSASNSSDSMPSSSAAGARKTGKTPAVNPKQLLARIAEKYDQYRDYGQQDGHELLRHLLDAMRMEEMDVSARASGSAKVERGQTILEAGSMAGDSWLNGSTDAHIPSLLSSLSSSRRSSLHHHPRNGDGRATLCAYPPIRRMPRPVHYLLPRPCRTRVARSPRELWLWAWRTRMGCRSERKKRKKKKKSWCRLWMCSLEVGWLVWSCVRAVGM